MANTDEAILNTWLEIIDQAIRKFDQRARKVDSKKKTPSAVLGVFKPLGTHVGTFLCLPTNRC
ncbi:hypothetical protein BCT26_05570 [Vibrio lentus]|nr:hypothetical protein BCU96_15405 [Vibrio lentus]PMH13067.1 hypothetical protein BCU76_20665 [Vibrio lentus]PMJ13243.1 hypothetical protein BCU30_14200 [Vibrio lentus]PMK95361.1 hypothetical protein BCT89_12495 [Vibrio lentus]PMN10527.1 hypothetical protein BCT39_12095 [Vibrio lentus]